jgi:hypothetical protein
MSRYFFVVREDGIGEAVNVTGKKTVKEKLELVQTLVRGNIEMIADPKGRYNIYANGDSLGDERFAENATAARLFQRLGVPNTYLASIVLGNIVFASARDSGLSRADIIRLDSIVNSFDETPP